MIEIAVRQFIGLDGKYSKFTEWHAGQRRMAHSDHLFRYRYLPAATRCRYWITAVRETGRLHIATGRAVRILSNSARPDQIVIELHCRAPLYYPRGVESPEAAPGFTFCPRCIARSGQPAQNGDQP
ncbi:MAG: hypothetical protein ACRDZU_13385 [Acidimicrobiales bacterium]